MFQTDLVERCKANDRKAQMRLYRQYSEGMYAVAMRFLRNPTDAEDVLQEAFLKAFHRIDQYRGEVTFGAWLKRIVINKSLDFIKARKEEFVELKEHSLHVIEDDDWMVEDQITISEVRDGIDRLSDKYRAVVSLYLIEGYDHSEISEILGLEETTCRTRLLRGKGQLKGILKNRFHGTGSQKTF